MSEDSPSRTRGYGPFQEGAEPTAPVPAQPTGAEQQSYAAPASSGGDRAQPATGHTAGAHTAAGVDGGPASPQNANVPPSAQNGETPSAQPAASPGAPNLSANPQPSYEPYGQPVAGQPIAGQPGYPQQVGFGGANPGPGSQAPGYDPDTTVYYPPQPATPYPAAPTGITPHLADPSGITPHPADPSGAYPQGAYPPAASSGAPTSGTPASDAPYGAGPPSETPTSGSPPSASPTGPPYGPAPTSGAPYPTSGGPPSYSPFRSDSTTAPTTPDPLDFTSPTPFSSRRIEPSPPADRSRLLIGLVAGLVVGLLVFGIGGFFTGWASAPDATPKPTASPSGKLGVFEQSQVALNRPHFAGTGLVGLSQGWLPYVSTCSRSGEPGGPKLNAGEKARVRCTLDGMSAFFVEYNSIADRDGARDNTLKQNVDARTLTPGVAAATAGPTPSGRTTGNYVEYAYKLTEGGVTRPVAAIWWDDAGAPVAGYLLAYWKEGVGESWDPMRDLWARYA